MRYQIVVKVRSVFCLTIVFLLALCPPTLACEITAKTWPGLIHYFIERSDGHYYLNLPDSKDAHVTAKFTDYKRVGSPITSSKRIVIVSGHGIEVDQVRQVNQAEKALSFRSTRGMFDGWMYLVSDEQAEFIAFTTQPPGLSNIRIDIHYAEPRPIDLALEDTVCAYLKVPGLLAAATRQ